MCKGQNKELDEAPAGGLQKIYRRSGQSMKISRSAHIRGVNISTHHKKHTLDLSHMWMYICTDFCCFRSVVLKLCSCKTPFVYGASLCGPPNKHL